MNTIPLKVNCFPIMFNPDASMYIFSLTYLPQIDDTKIRAIRKIFNNSRDQFSTVFTHFFLICGTQLAALIENGVSTFSELRNEKTKTIFSFTDNPKEESVIPGYQKILLSKPQCVNYRDVLNPKTEKAYKTAYTFLNQLLTQTLIDHKYTMLGKSSKYFNFSQSLHMNKYDIYTGLRKAIQCTSEKPLIRIDYCTRIFSSNSLLTTMSQLRSQVHSMGELKQQLTNKRIMTKYGQKGRFYRIDDVDFDLSPAKHKIKMLEKDNTEREMNLVEYYKAKYGLSITVENQPLIKYITTKQKRSQQFKSDEKVSTLSKEKQYEIYLVPELCYDVELPDSFYSNRDGEREQIDIITKPSSIQRYNNIYNALKPIKDSMPSLKAKGIKMIDEMMDITAKEIPINLIMQKSSITEKINVQNCSFNYRYFTPYMQTHELKSEEWIIICDSSDNETVNQFVANLKCCAAQRNVQIHNPQIFNCLLNNNRSEISQKLLQAAKGNYKKNITKVLIFILPFLRKLSNTKESYGEIKKVMYKNGIMSQVVLRGTLQRNKDSINDKVLLKILIRLGADLWRPEIDQTLPKKIMMMSIESANQSAVACASSYNQYFSKYYSQIIQSDPKIEAQRRILDITPYIKNSLKFFCEKAKSFPDLIIIYRKGKSEEEVFSTLSEEIKLLEEGLKTVEAQNNVKLPYTFITYNTRTSLRAFQMHGTTIENPSQAILIDDKKIIPSSEQSGIVCEFFLKPQYQAVGSCNFTHYRVLVKPESLSIDSIKSFTMAQCFEFYGFTGGIRVPAICQYTKKVAEKYDQTSQIPNDLIAAEKYAY